MFFLGFRNALFVGFAPLEQPKVAVAVIVENAGGGGTVAAPIARKVFDWVLESAIEKNQIAGLSWNSFDIQH